jgi:hypothetical protein
VTQAATCVLTVSLEGSGFGGKYSLVVFFAQPDSRISRVRSKFMIFIFDGLFGIDGKLVHFILHSND